MRMFVTQADIKGFKELLDKQAAFTKKQAGTVNSQYFDFVLQDTLGMKRSISEYVGKSRLLFVDFWASWCGPCRKELQHLKALYKELEGKGVKFVSVSLDNSPKAWARADEEEQLPWLSVRNLHGFDRKAGICKELDIKSIPFIVVLDKDGAIVAKSLMGEALRDKLSELLK